jgi:hypothetical protein
MDGQTEGNERMVNQEVIVRGQNGGCHWFRRQVALLREIARDSFRRPKMDDSSVMDGHLVSPIIPVLPLQVRLHARQLSPYICTDTSLLQYIRTMYQLRKLFSVSKDKMSIMCSAREGYI